MEDGMTIEEMLCQETKPESADEEGF